MLLVVVFVPFNAFKEKKIVHSGYSNFSYCQLHDGNGGQFCLGSKLEQFSFRGTFRVEAIVDDHSLSFSHTRTHSPFLLLLDYVN